MVLKMTKREFYLKLFNENEVALTAGIIALDRAMLMCKGKLSESEEEYIEEQRLTLDEEMPQEMVKGVFPN